MKPVDHRQRENEKVQSLFDIESFETSKKRNDPVKTSLGTALVIGIILTFGASQPESSEIASEVATDQVWDGFALKAVGNVMDATVPHSTTDLVAGVAGESIGGIIGAFVTAAIGFLLPRQGRSNDKPEISLTEIISKASADSDYFVAASAAYPLLQAAGLDGSLAYVASIVFGTVRSEISKISFQRRERVREEEILLQQLLREQQEKEKSTNLLTKLFSPKKERQSNSLEVNDLIPVVPAYKIDFVEVFTDTLRWLEYGVLNTELADTFAANSYTLDPALRGAGLGFLAALSSQLYADALYSLCRLGPENKQEEVDNRTVVDWATVYASTSLSGAALFGTYEGAERPISRWIQGTLAGGVDGCFGSDAFDQCLQTYIDTNAPGPSPEAQARALITNLVMVTQRLQDVAGDTTADDVKSLLAAWVVDACSYFNYITQFSQI